MSFEAAGASDRAASQGIFVILLILSILSFAFAVPLSEPHRPSRHRDRSGKRQETGLTGWTR